MELNLITPLPPSSPPTPVDEYLNGRWWCVKRIVSSETHNAKYHCVSYVWGKGTIPAGSFFNCQREISDQTRPALEAAMKALDTIVGVDDGREFEESEVAFWIDAICVPQEEGERRHGTLESMGFIYSLALSVIVILHPSTYSLIHAASISRTTVLQLSLPEMLALEADPWSSRVWTYQEIVNNANVLFTTPSPSPSTSTLPSNSPPQPVASYEPLLNCLGLSSTRFQQHTQTSHAEFTRRFSNLNTLSDTLLDARTAPYLARSALSVLSNMSTRTYDALYPGNRLLASLGALTQKPSWAPAETLEQLAEKLMATCEDVNDYSFIYTRDMRDQKVGLRWRPSCSQPESGDGQAAHLNPVLCWSSYGEPFGETQRACRDAKGLWLENMVRLRAAEGMSVKAQKRLDAWLYGWETDPDSTAGIGFLGRKEKGQLGLEDAMFDAIGKIGFSGSRKCIVCETGMFFSVVDLDGKDDVEVFATGSIRWAFGAPGLARWREGDGTKYSAGVYAGIFENAQSENLLLE